MLSSGFIVDWQRHSFHNETRISILNTDLMYDRLVYFPLMIFSLFQFSCFYAESNIQIEPIKLALKCERKSLSHSIEGSLKMDE